MFVKKLDQLSNQLYTIQENENEFCKGSKQLNSSAILDNTRENEQNGESAGACTSLKIVLVSM